LDKISATEPPLTFVFDGHGSDDGIFLQDGQIDGKISAADEENLIKISVDDLFENYRTRKFDPKNPDIFLFSSCFNSTFIRKFYELCENENVQKPIFLGESEFGQFAFSENNSFNNNFFEQIFKYDENSKSYSATIGNAISADNFNEQSNPTILFPDEKNRTRQLSFLAKKNFKKS